MNYATMGSYIGHKFVRSVDDYGRQLDARNTFIGSGWTDKTQSKYRDSAKCYVEQYDKYVEPTTRLSIDGQKTRDVNIADSIGLKIAHQAYEDYVNNNGDNIEGPLAGLKYDVNQLFFIAYAQLWCTKSNAEHLNETIVLAKESPAQFRVNGAVSNFEPFADAFKCRQNAPMNPRKKCDIW